MQINPSILNAKYMVLSENNPAESVARVIKGLIKEFFTVGT